ncbi:MAG: alpha/beta hydrolase [Holosporales bacterium]
MVYLEGPRLGSASGRTDSYVVFAHGYGADGRDLIDLAEVWRSQLPNTEFFSAHAPFPFEGGPFGRMWFSLENWEPSLLVRTDPQARAIQAAYFKGAEKAAAILRAQIEKDLQRLNLTMDRVALVGFSQGTMVSLLTALSLSDQPAGVLGYSGAFLTIEDFVPASKPPVRLIHGDQDMVLDIEAMNIAQNALKKLDVPVETYTRPGLGHSIDQDGLHLGEEFLTKLLKQ